MLEAGRGIFNRTGKKEICRLIHISTAPTTTAIYISIERSLVVVIGAVKMWITLPQQRGGAISTKHPINTFIRTNI